MQSEILRASAGSGKTYCLTERINGLIQDTKPFIIALTFTRAATAEMRKRLLDWVDQSPIGYPEKLEQIMRSGRVHFATFDSFFYQLLAAQGDPVQIADEKETMIIKEESRKAFFDDIHKTDQVEKIIIASKLLGGSIENLSDKLTDDGAQRFLRNDRSLARFLATVIETAKLKTEIRQLQSSLKGYFDPDLPARIKTNILGLADVEIQKLVERAPFLQPDLANWKWLGTKIVWHSSPYADINRIFMKLRDKLADYLINRALLRELTLTQMFDVYQVASAGVKRRERKIFFRDVLDKLIALDGTGNIERTEVMGLYFELGLDRVQHLMIDEFQDTSADNMALVLPLVEEVLSEVGADGRGERSLFLVGDWKQMIYAWRGADREALENGLSPYTGAQLRQNFLPCNWRSTPLLIDFFNKVVSEIFSGDEKYERQEPPPGKPAGGVSEINLFRVKMENQQRDPFYDRMVEAVLMKKLEWGCDYSDMTLLFRTNSEKEAMAQALSEAGIGFAEVKGRQILASEDGVAVFSLLTALFDPKGSGYGQKALEISAKDEPLLRMARDRETILSHYGLPHGLKPVSDILERCRGIIPDAVLEAYEEEAEIFFKAGGGDAKEFLSYLFKVRSKVSVPEPAHSNRVKLATIHGTKGLEFPHVFLLWIERNKPFPFFVDDIGSCLSFNGKETEFWQKYGSPASVQILEAQTSEREKIEREKANILYVALTRATSTISIFVKEPSKNKDEETGDEVTQKLISIAENGNFDAQCAKDGDRTSWRKDYGSVEDRAEKKITEIGPVTLPVIEGMEMPGVVVDRTLIASSVREGIERGERVHGFLAMLREDSTCPENHALSEEELDAVSSFLKDEKVSGIVFRKGKLYVEQPLSNRELYGVVDRMIIEDDRITLIDFKTGATDELLDSYREQLRRYGAILSPCIQAGTWKCTCCSWTEKKRSNESLLNDRGLYRTG